MNEPGNDDQRKRSWRTTLIVLALVVLYAYAFQATSVNLEEPLEPQRQENLVSLLRELARPDLLEYENETRSTNISIRMPCPEEIKGSQVTFEGRLVLMTPNCATTTQDPINVQGEGFQPNAEGGILWHPPAAGTPRRVADIKVNGDGTFSTTFTMPDIRETADPQRLEVVELISRRPVGLSDTTILALDKITETILMALMASTIGTLLAIPISFMAAQNLMADVKLPLTAIMAAVILAPAGGFAGWWAASQLVDWTLQLTNTWVNLGALALTGGGIGLIMRSSLVMDDDTDTGDRTAASTIGILLLAALFIFGLGLLGELGLTAGNWLAERLGAFGFVGNFIAVLGDLTVLLLPALVGFIGVLLGMSLGGRYGQEAMLRLGEAPSRAVTAILTAAGTAVLIFGIASAFIGINLLGIRRYAPTTLSGQLELLLLPVAIIGIVAGLATLAGAPKRPFPVGLTIYTVTRGSLNALRSIEPIMMGFVFVVWVGLGPFAGILALTLHSVADLGKLFSEQVENIDEGPREAVRATGANGVQSVVYAVVPQITPHYIAYIFYRWDINVRMSTIIGFVGGGGIGFVLQRFLNQLQYTRASVMVIAIAVVVTVLDYVSSRIRSRII